MKVAFHTLGCKVNQYETESLAKMFRDKGYRVVDDSELADIYIINTCTVTQLAARKSRQSIRRMKKQNPGSIVAVTGCYAQISPEEIDALEEVDLITGTNAKGRLPEYIEDFLKEGCCQTHIHDYEALDVYEETGCVTAMESRTRAYIKVQEGCNHFCSYCVIPYARGKVRSRAFTQVLAEAKNLIKQGVKEVVLTGINTALYGAEPGFLPPGDKISKGVQGIELLIQALDSLPGDFRIRLSSLEPTVVDQSCVKALLKYDRLCHHLHLSLQSGSDRILAAMNRAYTRDDYLNIIKTLKAFDPDYGITTDIIAGFPGEQEQDFQDSLDIIREAVFSKVHVFPYSKRPLTPAAEMKGQVASSVKKQRSQLLMDAASQTALEFFRRSRGKSQRVLFETYVEDSGYITGYTDNYIKVYVKTEKKNLINRFADVTLEIPFQDGMAAFLK